MKFDEGAQAEKLSLNLTPLIDVVFLLVLFFAVSSTFISTQELSNLNDQVASMAAQNTKLQQEIIDYRDQLTRRGEQIEYLNEMNRELESHNRKTQDHLATQTEVNASLEAEIVRYAQQVDRQSQATNRLQSDYRELQAAYQDLEQRLADLTSKGQASKKRAEGYASKLDEQAAVIQQLDNDYRSLRLNHARSMVAKQDEIEQLNLNLHLARTEIAQIEGVVSSLEKDKQALQTELTEKTEQNETLSKQLLMAFQTNQALKEEFVEINKTVSDNKATELMLREKLSQLQGELDRSRKLAESQSAPMERLRRAQLNLSSSLNRYLAEKTVGLTREQNRLVLQLPDKVLFDSGSSAVNPQGVEVLRKVGEILKSQTGNLMIQVGGHTDNVPVGAGRAGQFSSNWDLSAARAVNVVRFLESQVGIDPSRMSAVGYGEHGPVASNETEAGRVLNRRIEIVLLEP